MNVTISNWLPQFWNVRELPALSGERDFWRRNLVSANVHEHERNVIGRRALPPRSHAIENALFHFAGRQGRRLADNFLEAFDAEHLSPRIEHFANPVGIQEDAVVRLELHLQAGSGIHGVRQRAENHAAGLEQQRPLATAREHCRGMASSGKDHGASMGIDPRGGHRDKQSGGADLFDEEAVQLPEHVEEWHATAEVRSRLAVDSVRDQRGTDAVTGNITNEQAEVLMVLRIHQGEVASNRVHGMIEGVDAHGVPDLGSRYETPLDPRGEPQVFLDFHVTVLKLLVGGAESLLGSHLLGDVGERHDFKPAAGILECAGTDDDGQTTTALLRQNKSITVVPISERNVHLLRQKIPFL